MKNSSILNRGTIAVITLTASAILAAFAIFSIYLSPAPYALSIHSKNTTIQLGEPVIITVEAQAASPVNVFSGIIRFDPQFFRVEEISYNTSVANLWTEEPWYNYGDGTVSFAGGTTHNSGFSGKGTLLTITFIPRTIGTQTISIDDARILLHDGLGSDALVDTPDTIFTIIRTTDPLIPSPPTTIAIIPSQATLDLTGDGRITITDLSAFFTLYYRNDLRGDFNGDGIVTITDASILMSALRTN
jgi:hypothetical protein